MIFVGMHLKFIELICGQKEIELIKICKLFHEK